MDFYSEFRKIVLSSPRNCLNTRAAENCSYGDYLFRSRNVYLSFLLNEAEDCYYSENLTKTKDCIDCGYLSMCESCYECLDCADLYNCSFLQNCSNCSACSYCLDCINCKDCFGCFGLRQEQFCIFNKKYSEENYRKKVETFRKNPPSKILEILAPEFVKHPRIFLRILKGSEKCFGDYIYSSKGCTNCFNMRNAHDCMHAIDIITVEKSSGQSVDCSFASEINGCYDCDTVFMTSNCNFMYQCHNCSDSEYLVNCYNCRNCFGCTYLMNSEYCILNRQLTREEYLFAIEKFKSELKANGTYGKSLADILI